VVVIEGQGKTSDCSHCFVTVFLLCERLWDPKTAIKLDGILAHDDCLAV